MGEAVVGQLVILRLAPTPKIKVRGLTTVVSRTRTKAMTSLDHRAEVRLLRVSPSLLDKHCKLRPFLRRRMCLMIT